MAKFCRTLLHGVVLLSLIAAHSIVGAQDEVPPPFQLEHVETVGDGSLDAPTSVVVSPDGRFVYASAYKSGSHAVFSRDQKTGTLKLVQTVKKDHLAGSTALRLSPDGKLAAAASFGGRAISLYRRDDETGLLTLADVVTAGVPANVGLQYPVDAVFSPDSKYVDVVDRNTVSVLRVISDGDSPAFEFIETFTDPAIYSGRSLVHDPSGKYLFVASNKTHSLVALKRDNDSGRLSLYAAIQDETKGATGLESVFGVAGTADGGTIYTVSGQHGTGDNSVSVFRFDDEELTATQCIVPGEDELGRIAFFNANRNTDKVREVFRGGNEIAVSPDQSMVVACATLSSSLALFTRDKETGELTMIQLVVSRVQLGGVSGIAISPDNRHVYSANEFRDTVSVFQFIRPE